MSNKLTKNIIFMYLSGRATSMQKKMIEEWLQHEKSQEQFYEWLEEWETEHPQFIPDTEKALGNFLFVISNKDMPSPTINPTKKSTVYKYKKSLIWAAASLILMVLTYFPARDFIFFKTYKTAYGEIKKFQLEDRSAIILNANSSLKVPRFGFGKESRQVFLQGEAAFSVIHTVDNKRFIVNTPGNMNVEVLGTQFSVYSRNEVNTVKLQTGLVKVNIQQDKKKEQIIVKPGDVLSINNINVKNVKPVVKHHQPVQDFFAWKDHRFVFNNTPLINVLQSIKETFGIDVIIEDKELQQKRIEGSFKAGNVNELLNAFSQMYNIKIDTVNNDIVLKMIK